MRVATVTLTPIWQLPVFPRVAAVLALHARRLVALLRKARVVDDPVLDRLHRRQRRQSVLGREPTNVAVGPGRDADEVEQLIVHGPTSIGVAARARGDRLDALALGVTEETRRIQRERLPAVATTQDRANSVEIVVEAMLPGAVQSVGHAP